MKYALLIYSDEATNDNAPEELQKWFKYTEDLQNSGAMTGGEALQPVATATTVRVNGESPVQTDGPFAETKEQLGGFYLLDCETKEQALEWASKMPVHPRGCVEVRPVMSFE